MHIDPRIAPDPDLDSAQFGLCQSLTQADRFKVRHLVIRPGATIDTHSHFHRAEHWIAVQGSGRVTLDGQSQELFENQSIDIAVGTQHRIENHGKVDLHLIEVQTGTYLDDDDVIRPSS